MKKAALGALALFFSSLACPAHAADAAVAKLQADWLNEGAQQVQAYAGTGAAKKPEAILADGRAVAERALAVARQGFDLGVRAQSEVVDLFTKRAVANLGEVKSFAAAA